MGQELNGSLESWVTLSDPFPALTYNTLIHQVCRSPCQNGVVRRAGVENQLKCYYYLNKITHRRWQFCLSAGQRTGASGAQRRNSQVSIWFLLSYGTDEWRRYSGLQKVQAVQLIGVSDQNGGSRPSDTSQPNKLTKRKIRTVRIVAISVWIFRSSPRRWPSRLELRCVRPSVRPYVHKKFFRFPSNFVCGWT